MLIYYQGSIARALLHLYPNIGLDIRKFSNVPRGMQVEGREERGVCICAAKNKKNPYIHFRSNFLFLFNFYALLFVFNFLFQCSIGMILIIIDCFLTPLQLKVILILCYQKIGILLVQILYQQRCLIIFLLYPFLHSLPLLCNIYCMILTHILGRQCAIKLL